VKAEPPAQEPSRPLGVGVLGALRWEWISGVDPRRERLAVSVAAYHAGYHLLDVVEIDPFGTLGDANEAQAWVWALARDADAGAVFVRGQVDLAWLEPMADDLRMVIREVNTPITARSIHRPADPGLLDSI
jgi:hypothetical protein